MENEIVVNNRTYIKNNLDYMSYDKAVEIALKLTEKETNYIYRLPTEEELKEDMDGLNLKKEYYNVSKKEIIKNDKSNEAYYINQFKNKDKNILYGRGAIFYPEYNYLANFILIKEKIDSFILNEENQIILNGKELFGFKLKELIVNKKAIKFNNYTFLMKNIESFYIDDIKIIINFTSGKELSLIFSENEDNVYFKNYIKLKNKKIKEVSNALTFLTIEEF